MKVSGAFRPQVEDFSVGHHATETIKGKHAKCAGYCYRNRFFQHMLKLSTGKINVPLRHLSPIMPKETLCARMGEGADLLYVSTTATIRPSVKSLQQSTEGCAMRQRQRTGPGM